MKTAERLFQDAFEVELLDLAEDGAQPHTWAAAGRGKTKTNPAGEDARWWRANGPKMVQAWIDWRRASRWLVWTAPDGTPAIELDIEVNMPGTDQPLKMFIDRVMQKPDGTLVIVDLKTGSRTPESDLQLATYRYGIFKKYGVLVNYGAYWMARKGEPTEPFNLSRYTPNLMETWFVRFIEAKAADLFIPHPTFLCRACGMRDYCAAFGGSKSHMDPDFQPEEKS